MNYRGIITQGYHNDAGGQTAIRIVSHGYIGTLATVQQIFNIVERTIYLQVARIEAVMFGVTHQENPVFSITKTEEVLF